MDCSKCWAGNPIIQMEDRLQWLGYERDMIEEEGTPQELFIINQKIIKLHKDIIRFKNILVE